MIKIKNKAFTLSEVLITLSIVGILAVMVLPGLIKDTTNRSNTALLQGTVSNLSDAVQQEIFKKGAKSISETKIFTDPENFLKEAFDYSRGTDIFKTVDSEGKVVTAQYKTLNGGNVSLTATDATLLLRNGVYIGIIKATNTATIDINGAEPPNIVGVDYFAVEIAKEDDLEKGIRVGDVGGFRYDDFSDSALKTSCKAGNSRQCYALVERKGFDPNYLDN